MGLSLFHCAQNYEDSHRYGRILIIRQRSKVQKKGPVQLDLFEPYDEQFEFKAIVTNHVMGMASVMKFHNGRGSQEGIFAELKTHAQMDYVPAKRWNVNRIFVTCSVLAHNPPDLVNSLFWDHRRIKAVAGVT